MNITNKYCLLSELTQVQIDKLVELMPDMGYFDFDSSDNYIGFSRNGNAGTWQGGRNDEVTYKEMLSLLGAKEEEKLVPHVHQKEIIAWANGEEIEFLIRGLAPDTWVSRTSHMWDVASSYRVKPKLTPTQLRIQKLTEELMELEEQHNVECGVDLLMGRVGCQLLEG
jgi:hypothetical protein